MAHMYILAMSWAGVHKMCVHCTHNMKSSACACVHVCTMELVCVRHTHTVLCVCAFLSVVANACRLLKMACKCQPFWAQLHVHFSIRLSFKDTILWCSVKYLVDSCSLPEYGFYNGTLFIVIDEIVSPVHLPPCPIQWVMYKDLGNKTAMLFLPNIPSCVWVNG